MKKCYLTIDDSPSTMTDDMVNYLVENNIPALLFIRGALAAENPKPIIRAIKAGFVIGNHSYHHRPFGELSYEEAIADIVQCEAVIDNLYKQADCMRPGKYFRFPYLDRGDGDRIERHFENTNEIDINADMRVAHLQQYLSDSGFSQPFETDHPLYNNPSIRHAVDCLMTYTSFDWMLTPRHKGRWDYQSLDDLKARIDNDSNLVASNGNVLIFHDQDGLVDIFKTLIDHMLTKGYDFLPIK